MKELNLASIVTGVIGGYLCKIFGGYDVAIKSLLLLVVLDYITGISKAVLKKQLSSEVGYKGLIRKSIIFIVVAAAVTVERVIGNAVPLRDITIVFYICNEAISLLENAAEIIPLPEKLKSTFIQLRDKQEK